MKAKPCIWNGYAFESVGAAARALGVEYSNMSARVRRGYTCDADVQPRSPSIACEWNGVRYPSIQDAARANWISKPGMWYRIRRGYRSDADMQKGA